jgi:glutamate dehydrogenase (NADP+)
VYFVDNMLKSRGDSFEGKKVSISGAGNVAIYAAEKATQLGATVITMSDSTGWVHDPAGIDVEAVKVIKEQNRARISEYVKDHPGATYTDGREVWSVACDIALPCGSQNTLNLGRGCEHAHHGRRHGLPHRCWRVLCPW